MAIYQSDSSTLWKECSELEGRTTAFLLKCEDERAPTQDIQKCILRIKSLTRLMSYCDQESDEEFNLYTNYSKWLTKSQINAEAMKKLAELFKDKSELDSEGVYEFFKERNIEDDGVSEANKKIQEILEQKKPNYRTITTDEIREILLTSLNPEIPEYEIIEISDLDTILKENKLEEFHEGELEQRKRKLQGKFDECINELEGYTSTNQQISVHISATIYHLKRCKMALSDLAISVDAQLYDLESKGLELQKLKEMMRELDSKRQGDSQQLLRGIGIKKYDNFLSNDESTMFIILTEEAIKKGLSTAEYVKLIIKKCDKYLHKLEPQHVISIREKLKKLPENHRKQIMIAVLNNMGVRYEDAEDLIGGIDQDIFSLEKLEYISDYLVMNVGEVITNIINRCSNYENFQGFSEELQTLERCVKDYKNSELREILVSIGYDENDFQKLKTLRDGNQFIALEAISLRGHDVTKIYGELEKYKKFKDKGYDNRFVEIFSQIKLNGKYDFQKIKEIMHRVDIGSDNIEKLIGRVSLSGGDNSIPTCILLNIVAKSKDCTIEELLTKMQNEVQKSVNITEFADMKIFLVKLADKGLSKQVSDSIESVIHYMQGESRDNLQDEIAIVKQQLEQYKKQHTPKPKRGIFAFFRRIYGNSVEQSPIPEEDKKIIDTLETYLESISNDQDLTISDENKETDMGKHLSAEVNRYQELKDSTTEPSHDRNIQLQMHKIHAMQLKKKLEANSECKKSKSRFSWRTR